MFKRKKKDNQDHGLDIGLHPVEYIPEEEETSSNKKRLFIVIGVVFLAAILSFQIIGKLNQPSEEVTPTPDPVEVVDEPIQEEKPEPEPEPEPVVVKPISPVEGYVYYENGLLGVKMLYPETWYYQETSHTVLKELNNVLAEGSKFSLRETELDFVLPVVKFLSPDKSSQIINVSVIPTSEFNYGMRSEISDTDYLADKPVLITQDEIDDFGLTRYNIIYYYNVGLNTLVFDVIDVNPRPKFVVEVEEPSDDPEGVTEEGLTNTEDTDTDSEEVEDEEALDGLDSIIVTMLAYYEDGVEVLGLGSVEIVSEDELEEQSVEVNTNQDVEETEDQHPLKSLVDLLK